jgi:hypothetical protein
MKINTDISKRVDLYAKRGDTFIVDVNTKDADGQDFNFLGYTAKMEVVGRDRRVVLGFTSLSQWNDGFNDLFGNYKASSIELKSGKITLEMDAESMQLNQGSYRYELQLTHGDTVKTWLYGRFKINSDLT